VSVVSSLSPPRCRLCSSRRRQAVVSLRASFPWSKMSLSPPLFDNASFWCIPSRVEIESLNLHHRRLPPSTEFPIKTILEFQKNPKTLHLAPYFLVVVHKMKDSLKNKDCFYFVNKSIQWLHYQLDFFILYVVFFHFSSTTTLRPCSHGS
jgi:hypothetical protein